MSVEVYHLKFTHRFPPLAYVCADCGATLTDMANNPKLLCTEPDDAHANRVAWEQLADETNSDG